MFKKILKSIRFHTRIIFESKIKFPVHSLEKIERIGTTYGGWTIPVNFLDRSSICYLAGAGEDISFDAGIAEKYKCNVYIFDPTPKAINHFKSFLSCIEKGEKMPINNSKHEFYEINKGNLKYLHYYDTGLWDKEDIVRFYAPSDVKSVSHSILNLQQTTDYFEAKVDRLSSIMDKLGHTSVDLLKLDIEGAEYKVINSLIEDKCNIKMICVEYNEIFNRIDKNYIHRIKNSIDKLLGNGYVIIYIDNTYTTTFIKCDVLME